MATSFVNFLFDMAVSITMYSILMVMIAMNLTLLMIPRSNYTKILYILYNNGKTSMPNRSSKKVCSN